MKGDSLVFLLGDFKSQTKFEKQFCQLLVTFFNLLPNNYTKIMSKPSTLLSFKPFLIGQRGIENISFRAS